MQKRKRTRSDGSVGRRPTPAFPDNSSAPSCCYHRIRLRLPRYRGVWRGLRISRLSQNISFQRLRQKSIPQYVRIAHHGLFTGTARTEIAERNSAVFSSRLAPSARAPILDFSFTEEQQAVRAAIEQICA